MKFNWKRTLLCSLVFGWISLFWGSYDAIMQSIDYDVFGLNSIWHGVIIAADNILGLIFLPLFGRLSDKSNSRFGKRKPFIIVGTVISMIGFSGVCIFASLGKSYFIPFIISLLVTLSALSMYRSPGLAIVPDINPNRDRSRANALSNVVSVVFTVVAMLFFFIFMRFKGYWAIGGAIVITTLIMLVIFCFTVKENTFLSDMRIENKRYQEFKRLEDEKRRKNNELKGASEESKNEKFALSKFHALDVVSFTEDSLLHLPSFDSALRHESMTNRFNARKNDNTVKLTRDELKKIPLRSRSGYNKFCILAIVFCFYMAYNALTSNFIKYAEFILNFKQNDAIVPLILAQLAAILSFPLASMLSSKIGRKYTILIGFLLMLGSFGFSAYFTTPNPALYVVFAVLGISFGLVIVNIYPFFLELSSSNEIGTNTGYFSIAMSIAMVITPILSGLLITKCAYLFGGGANDGFRILFPYSIVFLALACILTLCVKGGKIKTANSKHSLEAFDAD
ncbi:MAG: MFS transporter [Clostridia bacterium]